METHIRVPGSLRLVMNLLERVMAVVMDKFSGQLTHQYSARLKFDTEKGMWIRMTVNNVCVPGGKKAVTLKFEDFYLDSGWLLTSLANFILETGATASCSGENPHDNFLCFGSADADGGGGLGRRVDESFWLRNARHPIPSGSEWHSKPWGFRDLRAA